MILPQPKVLSDSRFNGTFIYSYYWTDSWGIEEINEYESFTFDGTNKVFNYDYYKNYSNSSGWSYSGDYIGDHYSWYREFEICNGQYRNKLWDNSYSDWTEWENYEFSGDGKTLTLYNYYNIANYNKVLTKY
jgi:hypothetical protein